MSPDPLPHRIAAQTRRSRLLSSPVRPSQKTGAGFGFLYGALLESFKNPPMPRPTDKVVLHPVKSNVLAKAMTTMGRQTFMMAAVASVYSAGEVSHCMNFSLRPFNSIVPPCLDSLVMGGVSGANWCTQLGTR